MNETMKKRWIKALRSGKYLQAREYLKGDVLNDDGDRVGTGFCCLGVLCEVSPGIKWDDSAERFEVTSKKLKKLFPIEEGYDDFTWINLEWDEDKEGFVTTDESRLYLAEGSLPSVLEKEFGLNKKVQHNKQPTNLQSKLIQFNDAENKSFDQIADYVEKVL